MASVDPDFKRIFLNGTYYLIHVLTNNVYENVDGKPGAYVGYYQDPSTEAFVQQGRPIRSQAAVKATPAAVDPREANLMKQQKGGPKRLPAPKPYAAPKSSIAMVESRPKKEVKRNLTTAEIAAREGFILPKGAPKKNYAGNDPSPRRSTRRRKRSV